MAEKSSDKIFVDVVKTVVERKVAKSPEPGGAITLWSTKDLDDNAITERLKVLVEEYLDPDIDGALKIGGKFYTVDVILHKDGFGRVTLTPYVDKKVAQAKPVQGKKSLDELKQWWLDGLEKRGIHAMPAEYKPPTSSAYRISHDDK